jgi:DNA-binding MurR/RpiR family transcriptional regulator
LLLVGTPDAEPWHLAAHLDDESRWTGTPELSPTLVRYAVPREAPPHLSFTLERLEAARRGETVFVVSEESAPEQLLQRAWDARKLGATVLSLDAGDAELHEVAHESLTVLSAQTELVTPELEVVSFDSVQHLVSVAAGEAAQSKPSRSVRERMASLLESITGPRI